MMKTRQPTRKRPPSLQFLRGKAHALLAEIFPNRARRYMWLSRHFPKVHMSQMDRAELEEIIANLEEKKKTGHYLKCKSQMQK